MTPDLRSAASSARGAWLLLIENSAALARFDFSLRGFWQSFWAPAIMLVVQLTAGEMMRVAAGEEPLSFLLHVLRFIVYLTMWPLLTIPVARTFRLTAGYVPYVVVYNWSAVVTGPLFVLAAVLTLAGGFMADLGGVIYIVTVMFALGYQFLLASVALQAPLSIALGLVVLEFLLSFLVASVLS